MHVDTIAATLSSRAGLTYSHGGAVTEPRHLKFDTV